MVAVRVNTYQEIDGVEFVDLHQVIDGTDYVVGVPEDAVGQYEQAGWTKASAKVAKAAEKEDE
jgi:hypothetical protein